MATAVIKVKSTGAFNLGALKRVVQECETLGLPDSSWVENDGLGLSVVYTTDKMEPIGCGNHTSSDMKTDLIIQLHGGCEDE